MTMRHPADGRVHFSELKEHKGCPANVAYATKHARELTSPMIIGGVTDCIVFGNRGYAPYPGKVRNGAQWEAHKEANPGQYWPIESEFAKAQGAADAVLADPVARSLLEGCEFQRVMQWEAYGLPCAAGIAGERGGFDAIHSSKGYIADLKVTASTDPEEFMRHARRMFWPEQGKWYLDGAEYLALGAKDFWIIGVESGPPHNVTCLKLTPALLNLAGRRIRLWAERHRACEEAGQWPGYVQGPVDFDVSEWDLTSGEDET